MTLEITEQERDYLVNLLDARHTAMLHELHHTDARDFKEMLRQMIEMVEHLRAKVEGAGG
jgi:hypothetical protein